MLKVMKQNGALEPLDLEIFSNPAKDLAGVGSLSYNSQLTVGNEIKGCILLL